MHLLFIRHGESTANYLAKNDILFFLKVLFHPDSKLTERGLKQAFDMSSIIIGHLKKYEVIPILFSSILSRSIQTSNCIIKGLKSKTNSEISHKTEYQISEDSSDDDEGLLCNQQIFKNIVIPYIEEIPFFIPIDTQNQPRNLYDIMYEDLTNDESNLNFSLISDIPELYPYNYDGKPILRISNDFVKNFYESLDNIRTFVKKSHKLTEKSVLIFVSHGKLIKAITGHSVGNLGLVLQTDVFKNEVLFEGYS